MSCCGSTPVSSEKYIPIKVGEPVSSACERITTLGSIPEQVGFPGFTMVGGAVADTRVSNGGILNMGEFMKARHGCYNDPNARLASTCA